MSVLEKGGSVIVEGEHVTSDTDIVKFAESLDSEEVRTLAIIV